MRNYVDALKVVPEFDMPAHSNAWALGAPAGTMVRCPQMKGFGNTTGKDTEGNPQAYFDATSETAYTFLDAFIGEMAGYVQLLCVYMCECFSKNSRILDHLVAQSLSNRVLILERNFS